MSSSDILIVPCCEPGKGGGHLSRCVNLVQDLRICGRTTWLYAGQHGLTQQTENLLHKMNFNFEWVLTGSLPESLKIQFIVLDRFQTPLDELLQWKKIAPVIGIDEGGKYRDCFDFLVDMLIPVGIGKPLANIADPSLLLKKNFTTNSNLRFAHEQARTIEQQRTERLLKILISFGHEDSAGLGLRTALLLSKISKKHSLDITLLKGVMSANNEQITIDNVKILDSIPNLAEHLGEYDIVITHYGLTAYEALFAGTAVLLDHPTPYHKKLAKAAGFLDIKNLKSIINSNKNKSSKIKKRFQIKSSCGSWLINEYSPQINRQCPVCAENAPNKSLIRFPDRTYRRCAKCGIIYMDRTNPPPFEYEKEYFFEQYKKQYGKTYLEDFENIKNAAKRRIKIIKSLSSQPALLDIGCAYGPFLAAALEEGFTPAGLDPAEDAVRYVQEKLGITAIHGFFPNSKLSAASFNAITLWFVIEHFTDCVSVLSEIKKLLKKDGILAFSTPSFSGISGRANLRRFLSASPADHFTVWSPRMAKKALLPAGFEVKKIVITGHHPERFPLFGKFAKNRKSPLYWILLAISRIFGLGDTVEIYAGVV